MKAYTVEIKVNGQWKRAEVTAKETLLDTLRNRMMAYETKNGCGKGDCGACAVLLQGRAVNACLTLALQADGKEVTTLRGIGNEEDPHPLQEKFVHHGAIQCGFCTSGMIVSAKYLLDQNPSPTRQEIREGLAGNLCRCTGYKKIVDAVEDASR